jgi:hypothetical protein
MRKNSIKKAASGTKSKPRKDPNRYPKGWDRKHVESVIAHYENQSEDDAVAEDEAAYHNKAFTMMAVPVGLIPRVRKLIDKRAG